jgi:hypothetical protein
VPDAYRLTIQQHATFLHAKGEGPRTPENALRYFREVHAACMAAGILDVIVEMAFDGPPFDPATIFAVISDRAPDGAKLRRIAYVESSREQAPRAPFAETIAVNRGVNVRLFPDVPSAARWLAGD